MHESCPTLYIISGTGQGSLLYYIIYYYCIYHHGRTDRIIGWSSMQAAATIISGRAFHIAAACRRDAPAPATNEVAAAERQDKCSPRNSHFDQLLEKPCTNHGYPVSHKFKDCDLMKHLLRWMSKTDGDGHDKQPAADQDKDKPAEGSFP